MRKNIWGLLGIVFALFSGFFTRCAGSETEFISSEYTITQEEAQEKLKIEPHYIHSQDEAIVTATIENESIVITSRRSGSTVVSVGDAAGFINSAHIDITVNETGAIIILPSNYSAFQGENKVKAVIKQNITISGTVNTEITPVVIPLMMDNNSFKGLKTRDDVSTWITNLPGGLTAKITYIQVGDYPHEVSITISGTPLSASSEALQVIIPMENSARQAQDPNPFWNSIYVEPRAGATFSITGA